MNLQARHVSGEWGRFYGIRYGAINCYAQSFTKDNPIYRGRMINLKISKEKKERSSNETKITTKSGLVSLFLGACEIKASRSVPLSMLIMTSVLDDIYVVVVFRRKPKTSRNCFFQLINTGCNCVMGF